MFSKFIKKDDRFFRQMEASAEEARLSMDSLAQLIKNRNEKQALETLAKIRRQEKAITRQLLEDLCKGGTTPLEREDIEALASTLYKITKLVEKFCERLSCSDKHTQGMSLAPYQGMLETAGTTVLALVKELRALINVEKVKALNDQLQKIEGDADKLMLDHLRVIYNDETSGVKVMVQKDLYEILEKIFDRCRDLGNLVFHIVLKHA
jgi:uncharacterized protein